MLYLAGNKLYIKGDKGYREVGFQGVQTPNAGVQYTITPVGNYLSAAPQGSIPCSVEELMAQRAVNGHLLMEVTSPKPSRPTKSKED